MSGSSTFSGPENVVGRTLAVLFSVLVVGSIVVPFALVGAASPVPVTSLGDPDADLGQHALVQEDVEVPETIAVTGRIVHQNGSPAADDTVAAFDAALQGEPVAATLTNATGHYSLAIPAGNAFVVGYYQGDVVNMTAVMPRDGSPDGYGIAAVNETADRDLGTLSLPSGHVVDVQVVDGNGTPIEGAVVAFEHVNAETGGVATFGNETGSDGRVSPNGEDTGVELGGNVTVSVYSSGGESKPVVEELSVTGPTSPQITVQNRTDGSDGYPVDPPAEPGSADLVVEPAAPGAGENVTFRVTNESVDENASVGFYSWSFGDDDFTTTYSPENETTHAYAEPGVYAVRVTAQTDLEEFLFTAERTVTVGDGWGLETDEPWGMVGQNSARSSYNPNVIGPQSEVSEYWSADLEHNTVGQPVVADGVAYVATGGYDFDISDDVGRLYAFDTLTGAEHWNVTLSDRATASPAVVSGVVYVGTADNRLHGYESDGTPRVPIYNAVDGATSLRSLTSTSDALVVAGSSQTTSGVVAYSPNGVEQWQYTIDEPYTRSPAVVGDRVYVPINDSVVALNATTGAEVWDTSLASGVVASTASATSDFVYVTSATVPEVGFAGNVDGAVHALHTTDGAIKWSQPIDAYVSRWSYTLDRTLPNASATTIPAVVGDTVYVGGANLTAFDAMTGAPSATLNLSVNTAAGIDDALAVTDTGTVYVTSHAALGIEEPDDLYAVRDGEVWWQATTSLWHASNPVANDGTLFATHNRRLVALGAGERPNALLGVNRTDAEIGDPISFDASDANDDGEIVEYRWDFDGDGTVDRTTLPQDHTVVHSYDAAGTYDATLTVVDDDSLIDVTSVTVTVSEPFVPAVSLTGTWPQFHYDAANTGYNASATGPLPPVEEAWKIDGLGARPKSPAVWNGTVYSTEDARITTYDAASGQQGWSAHLRPAEYTYGSPNRFEVTSSPTIVDGIVYVGAFWNDDHSGSAYDIVYALDAESGDVLWDFKQSTTWDGFFDDGLLVTEPKVEGDRVVFTAEASDSVYALDLDGNLVWSDELQNRSSGQVRATAAVSDGRVFVTQGWNGEVSRLYAFNLDTGNHLWNESVTYQYDGATPTVKDGVVYIAPMGNSLVAFDAETGDTLWSGDITLTNEYGSPAIAGDLLIAPGGSTSEPGIYAYDLTDEGTLVWTFPTGNAVYGAPAVAGNRIYFGTNNYSAPTSAIYAIDLTTGSEVWRHSLSTGDADAAPVRTSVAVADGVVYARTGNNGAATISGGRALYAIATIEATGDFEADLVADPGSALAFVTDVTLGLENTTGVAPERYEWNFGDGTTIETTHPSAEATHTYAEPGTYTAGVIAYDSNDTAVLVEETTVTVEQASGDLVATPTTADVNVTDVEFALTNVTAGVTPDSYSWDLMGDGQFEATTTHPVTSTNYTYDDLLGETTARVVVRNANEDVLFDAETALDVVDRIPPVVRASVEQNVSVGHPVEVDASNSTDNHRIASYTFTTDEGETVTSSDPIGEVTFDTPGVHPLTVAAIDESENTNETTIDVMIRDLADLSVAIDVPENQNLSDGSITATLNVSNAGFETATDVDVALDASVRTSWYRSEETTITRNVGDIGPNSSTQVTIDITDFVGENLEPNRPDVDLTATVDPDGQIDESDVTNNVDRATTTVRFSDISAYVYVPGRSIPTEPVDVKVRFTNVGSMPSEEHTAELDFGDGSENQTITVPSLDRYDRNYTTLSHSFENGTNAVAVTITDDPVANGNVDTDETETGPVSPRLAITRAPDEVERDETFRISTITRVDYRSDLNTTIELPAGLELVNGVPEKTRASATYNYATWHVRGTAETDDGAPYQINVTATARGQDVVESTTVAIVRPTLRVTNSSSVSTIDDGIETTTIEVRNEETFEHLLDVSAQLGAEGRTLTGLEYLFRYPYACVEQTTSPLLAALNTDQYYRSNPPPGGYDEGKVNESVRRGVERLTTGDNAQHENGAWSMYGNDPAGNIYYTALALFGTSSVAADPVQGVRPDVQPNLDSIDRNATPFWFEDRQDTNGRLVNDKNYFDDSESMTGFTLVALDRGGPYNATATAAVARIQENATAYLVDAQHDDGSWGNGGGNAMSTSLAVWGLAVSDVDSAEVEAAIDDGVAWLVDKQQPEGAWTTSRSSSWRATGTTSETTGYAVMALNSSGLPAENESVARGTSFLVGTYDDEGSWGYTRASSMAIEALLAVGVESTNPSQEVTVHFGTIDDPEQVTTVLTVDDGDPTNVTSLTEPQLETLRDGGPSILVTVETEGTGHLVLGVENAQLVDRDEYEANTGGD